MYNTVLCDLRSLCFRARSPSLTALAKDNYVLYLQASNNGGINAHDQQPDKGHLHTYAEINVSVVQDCRSRS